ncbi:hypothetical protein FACS1894176_00480 [Bacteroidia bacterium]|nr:hypothetical protein FACS1894176_00480 [Bacteroidia bacterium]
MLHESFSIVQLIVSPWNRDDDGFDIEKFLFGEGSGTSAGEAEIRFFIDFSHFFLGQKIERLHIFMGKKWLEIIVEFSQRNVEKKAGCDERIRIEEFGKCFVEDTGSLRASHDEDCRVPPFGKGGRGDFVVYRDYLITQNLSHRDCLWKYLIKPCKNSRSITGSNTINESWMHIRFVDDEFNAKKASSKDHWKSHISTFTKDRGNTGFFEVS